MNCWLLYVLLGNLIPWFFQLLKIDPSNVLIKNITRFLIKVNINKKFNCVCRWDFSFANESATEFKLLYDIPFAMISWMMWGFQHIRQKFFILIIFIITWESKLLWSFKLILLAASQIAKCEPLTRTLVLLKW